MSEKKSFWEKLFSGSGCNCGMSLEEETEPKKKPQKGGCCNMQIVEEDETDDAEHRTDK
ncbi:hypothetical protein [Ruminococcus sp. 5_1_39BFAA]|uniref:hypothetical protein n=1 Tax=Ruminococcus sp. 5_1_39BFAA TaxID=457412 RepID=UPI003568F16C